jgi:antitoxin component YwqK of YwqJK toxin-antitoxin module
MIAKPQRLNQDRVVTKYHANGKTIWSIGKILNGQPDGYWQWFRKDGTMKRSGYFIQGKVTGTWITYDQLGKPYKTTLKKDTQHGKK